MDGRRSPFSFKCSLFEGGIREFSRAHLFSLGVLIKAGTFALVEFESRRVTNPVSQRPLNKPSYISKKIYIYIYVLQLFILRHAGLTRFLLEVWGQLWRRSSKPDPRVHRNTPGFLVLKLGRLCHKKTNSKSYRALVKPHQSSQSQ